MDNLSLNPTDSDEGGWRRRFKGKVELLRHVDDRIAVVVQLYSLLRPPDSDLVIAKERVSQFDAANQADHAVLGKSYVTDEQVLFLSTVDPAYHLLLRIVATRATPAASAATVIVEARSSRLPNMYEPGRLDIHLSADDQEFTDSAPTTFGYSFSEVPINKLGSLQVSVAVSIV
jgi:hypothetical protein